MPVTETVTRYFTKLPDDIVQQGRKVLPLHSTYTGRYSLETLIPDLAACDHLSRHVNDQGGVAELLPLNKILALAYNDTATVSGRRPSHKERYPGQIFFSRDPGYIFYQQHIQWNESLRAEHIDATAQQRLRMADLDDVYNVRLPVAIFRVTNTDRFMLQLARAHVDNARAVVVLLPDALAVLDSNQLRELAQQGKCRRVDFSEPDRCQFYFEGLEALSYYTEWTGSAAAQGLLEALPSF